MDTQIYKTVDGKNYNKFNDLIIDCKCCGAPTTMTGTKLCDKCWNAKGIFNHIEKDLIDDGLSVLVGGLDPDDIELIELIEKLRAKVQEL